MFDVLGGIEVCPCCIATAVAGETVLSRSIRFGNVSTMVALLTGMPWIHENHWHPSERRLVGDILPQLKEAPVRVSWPLLASGLNPVTDSGEVLQSDPCTGALRRLHETLGNGVIGVLLKSGLFASELSQSPPCRPGAMALQPFASRLIPLAFLLYRLAGVYRPVRVHGKVDDAQIDTKDTLNTDGLRLKDITDHCKVERSFDVHQVHEKSRWVPHSLLWGGKRGSP